MKDPNIRYVICYPNDPQYKGTDLYYKIPTNTRDQGKEKEYLTSDIKDALSFYLYKEAVAYKKTLYVKKGYLKPEIRKIKKIIKVVLLGKPSQKYELW